MMRRQANKIYGKPRKGGKAKGIAQFKCHEKFEQILNQAEVDFTSEMEKRGKPLWDRGAKEVIPHLVWSYTNSDVDPGKKEQNMEIMKPPFFLCACAQKKI